MADDTRQALEQSIWEHFTEHGIEALGSVDVLRLAKHLISEGWTNAPIKPPLPEPAEAPEHVVLEHWGATVAYFEEHPDDLFAARDRGGETFLVWSEGGVLQGAGEGMPQRALNYVNIIWPLTVLQ